MILKSCRFCGASDPELMTKEGKGEKGIKKFSYYVRCRSCYARGSKFDSFGKIDTAERTKAVIAWNG
jgi:hypothetical protein